MMDAYTEFVKSKKANDKIKIEFSGEREALYSGFEINQITGGLNNCFYKNELINTLNALLDLNIEAKNIYVLDASVKFGNQYTKLKKRIH